jgi:TetR/AcrR family transcriptional repressor of mexCD-oprJ operon
MAGPTTENTTDHRRAIAERNIDAILDATEHLLQQGSQTSIAAVAAEAGLSRVTVYAHFPSREALLEAVVERAVRRTIRALEQAEPERGSPTEALERLVAAGWREVDRNHGLAQAALSDLSPAALRRAHRAAHRRLAELLERGRQEGSFRADLPTHWLITAMLALIHAAGDEVRAGRVTQTLAPQLLTASIRSLLAPPPDRLT